MVGPLILGPAMLGVCSTWASAMTLMATPVASATVLVIASLIICSVAIVCFILLLVFICFSAFTTFLLLTPCYKIVPYYDDNAVHMLDSYIYYLCIVKLVPIIICASTYIHNKCSLLLTHNWLWYVCCKGCASLNSLIINIATLQRNGSPSQSPTRQQIPSKVLSTSKTPTENQQKATPIHGKIHCVERPSEEGAPLDWEMELCGCSSHVWGLRSLLNTHKATPIHSKVHRRN